jgi:hypothetical protein
MIIDQVSKPIVPVIREVDIGGWWFYAVLGKSMRL